MFALGFTLLHCYWRWIGSQASYDSIPPATKMPLLIQSMTSKEASIEVRQRMLSSGLSGVVDYILYVSKSHFVVIWHVFSRGQWHLCCWGECTHRHLMNFGPNSLRNCNSKWRIICCIVFVNQTLQFERKCVNAPPNLLAACWVSNFYRRSIQCLNAIVFGKIPLSQIVRTFHTPLILFCRTFNVSVEL